MMSWSAKLILERIVIYDHLLMPCIVVVSTLLRLMLTTSVLPVARIYSGAEAIRGVYQEVIASSLMKCQCP